MDITPKQFKTDYETTFILTPELPEDERKAAVDKFVTLIKENDGEIINMEQWGLRKLAYPINKRTQGFYVFIEFNTYGDFVSKLEQQYRYDTSVMRYLTVKLDKHAVAYNQKRREQGFGLRKEMVNNGR
ncbi:MAG: 30S ribosomal protein S6 [Bacteroidota bacterium]